MMNFSKIVSTSIFLLLIQCYLVKSEDTYFVEVKNEFRLNNDVKPTTYYLKLDLSGYFETNPKYTGEVTITVVTSSEPISGPTSKPISLNIKQIEVENVVIKKTGSLDIIKPTHKTNETLEMLTLTFENGVKLEPGEEYQIEIKFTGTLHDDMYGLYRSTYLDENNTAQWIATTQFQATHARRAFPCFDEPNQKAKFTIQIRHQSSYHALSNTQVDNSVGSWIVTTTFKQTPIMSTYLIAIVVSKFAKISQENVDDINHALYSPKEVIGTGQYGFVITPKILQAMKGFTGVSYKESTLGKIDQVAIPDFSAGAMENWGLVTYRETALLWNPSESSAKNKERVATVIAHELAHMWFGNLITLDWWSYTWLNEGFARFFQYRAAASVERDWELDTQFVVEQQQSVFVPDANENVEALTSNCNTPSEISSKFGTISYNKGASVIRMMEHFMGAQNFDMGIKEYFKDPYKHFGNTKPEDLWNAMSQHISTTDTFLRVNFVKIMEAWTEQKGFPVVQVQKIDDSTISFSQKRFLYGGTDNETKWYIPITYTTSRRPNFQKTTPSYWLKKDTDIVLPWNSATKWIVVNIQASGYYRVQYDDDLYKELATALMKTDYDLIPRLNRAQIVDDALNLAHAGEIAYPVALDVVEYLKNETDYYPWYSAFNSFAYLKRRIDSKSELAQLLEQYITDLMTKFYNTTKFDEGFYDQIENHKRVLSQTWACELHDNKCISNSQTHFNMLKELDVEIDPNIRSVVYCTAMRNAQNRSSWNYLYDRFTKTQVASEAVTILSALGCTRDEILLEEYLQLSIEPSSKIRSQDALSVFTSVLSGNQENVPVALDFLQHNFKQIAANYGSLNALSSVITSIADRLTTKGEVDILESFVTINKEELKDAAEVADRAIKSARENLKWVENNQEVLLKYFKDRTKINSASRISTTFITGTVLLIIYYVKDFIFV